MPAIRRTALLTAALLALALPAAAGPFDGTYYPGIAMPGSWDCKSLGMDGGALSIGGDTLIGVENSCALTDPVEVRDMHAVLYDAVCSGGEGESTTERLMLMSSDQGVYVIRDGFVADWLRCPAP